MAYWACASLGRVELGLHFLKLAGFTTYCPRVANGRSPTLLFPGYVFIHVELQWHAAARSPGVRKLIMSGEGRPAPVPDRIIASLRKREDADGLITLPKRPGLRRGDEVRITAGAFRGQLALFEGMRAHERVLVLLQLFGTERRIELARRDIARA